MRQKALALSGQAMALSRWRERRVSRETRIVRGALSYDATRNEYSLVPQAVAPNLVYSKILSVEAILHAWPFFHGKLLDIGAGEKPYALFVESLVTEYVALELPDASGSGESDIWADGQRLPFRSESFDTVFCTDVLNTIPAPITVFREANRVLKLNGHLILLITNGFDLADRKPVLAHYTADGLRMMAENSGFNVIVLRSKGKVIPYFYNLFVQVSYRIVQKIMKLRGPEKNRLQDHDFLLNRFMVPLQLFLRKLTPKKSVDSSVEWIEGKDSRIISGTFHLGFLLVAKKVFKLDE